jgi:hypothetical protein
MFNTTGSNGASIAPSVLGTVRCYKNNTAGSVNTSGITTAQFNSLTGVYSISIDTTNAFYTEAADYIVILEGSTIDGQSVTTPLFQFSIANRYDAIADAVWLANRNQYNSGATMGHSLNQIRKANYVTDGTVTSTVTATTTVFSTNLTNEDGSLDHQSLLFLTGPHIGTSIPILNYSLTNGLVQLEETLPAPPTAGTEFVILPQHVHSVAAIAAGVWNELSTGYNIANTFGKILKDLSIPNTFVAGAVTGVINATYSSFSTNLTALDDTYDHQTIVFTSGNLLGQSVPVDTFTQTNGLITTEEPLTYEPQPGDTFAILPVHVHSKVKMADAFLSRLLDSSGSSNDVMNERTVRSALRAMRNKVIVESGNISVYKEDDVTAAWEGSVSNTTDVTVNPDGGS